MPLLHVRGDRIYLHPHVGFDNLNVINQWEDNTKMGIKEVGWGVFVGFVSPHMDSCGHKLWFHKFLD
jgi:hypothetical protein